MEFINSTFRLPSPEATRGICTADPPQLKKFRLGAKQVDAETIKACCGMSSLSWLGEFSIYLILIRASPDKSADLTASMIRMSYRHTVSHLLLLSERVQDRARDV